MNKEEQIRNWYWVIFRNRLFIKKNFPYPYTCYIFKDKSDKDKYLSKYPILSESKNNIFLCEESLGEIPLIGQRILEVYLVSSNFEEDIREIVKDVQESDFKSDVMLLECEKSEIK